MRLQRALARAGVASRRAAEELITDGKVRIDGKVATLGMKVDPAKQKITVGGRAVKPQEVAHGFIFFPGEAKKAKELRLQLKAVDTGKVYSLILKF